MNARRLHPLAISVALAAAVLVTPAVAADDTLFLAFGGKPGLVKITDDLWVAVKADPRMAPFFKDTKESRFKEQLVDQLCELLDGPCKYAGDPMKEVHQGLKIGATDFNALVEVLQEAMTKNGVPFGAQNRLLAKLAPMHRIIVTK